MSSRLAVIAGLGNPEARYANTLHNAGFWVADEIARRAGAEFRYEKRFDAEVGKATICGVDVWLVKPMSYMNLSGGPVRAVLDYYRLSASSLLVAHDEIDLDPGVVRLKLGGGHGGHNGLRDIIKHCGADFMRLRIGVGHPGDKDKVTGYVLTQPSKSVEPLLQRAVDEAADIIPVLLDRGLNEATKDLHTRTYPH